MKQISERYKAWVAVVWCTYVLFLLSPTAVMWNLGLIPAQFVAYGLLFLLIFFALFRYIWIFAGISLPFALLVPVELFLLTRYKTSFTAHVLGVISETNAAEAGAFIGQHQSTAVLGLGGAALFWVIVSVFTFKARFTWRESKIRPLVVSLGTLTLMTIQVAFGSLLSTPVADEDWFSEPAPYLVAQLAPTRPFGLAVVYWAYAQEMNFMTRGRARLADRKLGITDTSTAERSVFVVIIGESARSDRWSLNGYARLTNPRLSKVPNLHFFPDTIAALAATRQSVPQMLTNKPTSKFGLRAGFHEKSFIAAFKEAGYQTAWYSNQFSLGSHDTVISVLAKDADDVQFLSVASSYEQTSYDEVLLAPLRRKLRTGGKRQLIVLHTMGSHITFVDRYPDKFDVFKPSDKGPVRPEIRPEKRQEISNAYDNSILYTDHVIAEVIELLKQENVVGGVMYASDHGEMLFEPGCDYMGHGFPSIATLRTAALFWPTDKFVEEFPQKRLALAGNHAKKLTVQHVYPSLLDAAGLRYVGENLSKSIFSDAFKEQPRYYVSSNSTYSDFDKVKPQGVCKFMWDKDNGIPFTSGSQ